MTTRSASPSRARTTTLTRRTTTSVCGLSSFPLSFSSFLPSFFPFSFPFSFPFPSPFPLPPFPQQCPPDCPPSFHTKSSHSNNSNSNNSTPFTIAHHTQRCRSLAPARRQVRGAPEEPCVPRRRRARRAEGQRRQDGAQGRPAPRAETPEEAGRRAHREVGRQVGRGQHQETERMTLCVCRPSPRIARLSHTAAFLTSPLCPPSFLHNAPRHSSRPRRTPLSTSARATLQHQ